MPRQVIEVALPKPTGWRRRWVKSVLFSVVLVAALTVGVAVYRAKEASRSTGWKLLTSGTYHGVGWTLYASLSRGYLCMELFGPTGPNDPINTSSGYPGACEFDQRWPTGTYLDGGIGPAGSAVQFGPLPTRATSIRLAPHLVAQAHPLPHGLKRGNYWIEIFPHGAPLIEPQPLDAHGHPVAFTPF